ncbi:MAG: thioredoxin [Ignavibacteriaceae bacterium]|nr:thioredoxin [Ignavibacteriaceae bacterium]
MAVEITDGNFQNEVLNSNVPVMIDFWAEWCGPCKRIAPIVDEVSKEYAGKAKVGKLNVDDNQQVAMQYGIRSIPALLFFHNGQVYDQIIGVTSKDKIVDKLRMKL